MKVIKTLLIIILSFICTILFFKVQSLKKQNLVLKQKISQKNQEINSLKLKIKQLDKKIKSLNKKPKVIIINELNNSKKFIPKQIDINSSILKLNRFKKNSPLEIMPKIEFNKKTKKLDKIILEYKTKF